MGEGGGVEARERRYWEKREDFVWLTARSARRVLSLAGKLRGAVLEVCAGSGMFTRRIDTSEVQVLVTLDLSSSLTARLRRDVPRAQAVVGSASALCLKEGKFDEVLILGGLHHVPDVQRCLEECCRVLRRGGRLVCLEPNLDAVYRPLLLRLRRVLKLYTEDETFLRPLAVKAQTERAGFGGARVRYVTPVYNVWWVRWWFVLFVAMKLLAWLAPSRFTESFFLLEAWKK